MRRSLTALVPGALFLFAGFPAVSAQELSEICPDAADGTGAIWGLVTDPDAGMGLPGARVIASWTEEGDSKSAEVETQLDGQYTLCYVPLGTDLVVRPMFATVAGDDIPLNLEEVFTRQDISFSMAGTRSAGGADGGDERIWMCIEGGDSELNLENSRLIRCENYWKPLERCPKEELGRVTANRVGGGSGAEREMIESMVLEARRLGANALINVELQGNMSSATDESITAIVAEGVRIEVDPSTC